MKVFISVQKMFNPTHLGEMFNVLNSDEGKSGGGAWFFFHTKNEQATTRHHKTKWWSAKTTWSGTKWVTMDHNVNLSVILLDDTSLCDAKGHLLARPIPYNCAHARNRKRATSHALRMVSPILCHDVLLWYDTTSNAKLSIFDRYSIQ